MALSAAQLAEKVAVCYAEPLLVSEQEMVSHRACCNHREYVSRNEFMMKIRLLIQQLEKEKYQNNMCQIVTEIDGPCQQCAIHAMANIKKVLPLDYYIEDTNLFYQKPRIHKPEQLIVQSTYFISCLDYPSIAKFIYNQSPFWVYFLDMYLRSVCFIMYCNQNRSLQDSASQ